MLASSVLLFGKLDTYSGEWPFLKMSTLCFLFRTVFKYWKIKIKPHLWPLLGVCEFGFQKLARHSQHVLPGGPEGSPVKV